MVLGGNPTAIQPPAIDTVSDFLLSSQFCRFPVPTFQVFKALGGGGEGGCAPGIPKVIKKVALGILTVHIFACRLM